METTSKVASSSNFRHEAHPETVRLNWHQQLRPLLHHHQLDVLRALSSQLPLVFLRNRSRHNLLLVTVIFGLMAVPRRQMMLVRSLVDGNGVLINKVVFSTSITTREPPLGSAHPPVVVRMIASKLSWQKCDIIYIVLYLGVTNRLHLLHHRLRVIAEPRLEGVCLLRPQPKICSSKCLG
jgi:hypothetical protein